MQWLMLQQDVAEDFVIATGVHSVREFIDVASSEIGISITWKGKGKDEKVMMIMEGIVAQILNIIDLLRLKLC